MLAVVSAGIDTRADLAKACCLCIIGRIVGGNVSMVECFLMAARDDCLAFADLLKVDGRSENCYINRKASGRIHVESGEFECV